MGEVYFKVQINGSRLQPHVNALLDTGSSFNVLGYELADGHLTFDIGEENYDSEGAEILIPDTKEKQTFGTLRFESINIGGFIITHPRFTTFVLMEIADEALVGYPLMQYMEMIIDLRKGKDIATINKS